LATIFIYHAKFTPIKSLDTYHPSHTELNPLVFMSNG